MICAPRTRKLQTYIDWQHFTQHQIFSLISTLQNNSILRSEHILSLVSPAESIHIAIYNMFIVSFNDISFLRFPLSEHLTKISIKILPKYKRVFFQENSSGFQKHVPKRLSVKAGFTCHHLDFSRKTLGPLTGGLLKYSHALKTRAENNSFIPYCLDCLLGIVKK